MEQLSSDLFETNRGGYRETPATATPVDCLCEIVPLLSVGEVAFLLYKQTCVKNVPRMCCAPVYVISGSEILGVKILRVTSVTLSNPAEKVAYLIIFHILFVLFVWTYWKSIFTLPVQPGKKVRIPALPIHCRVTE
ncbi:hypothetical protein CIB84_000603 [Bambusicola thoracicus]|uniref:Uncharacterized protein n=1 Tax=Bambusicola thoracicus TaxID=9083 RepID=A0A2P4TH03_BAMTH|nr:hypothetical protein CIB84_000603 [Bambusicola thoracicus]